MKATWVFGGIVALASVGCGGPHEDAAAPAAAPEATVELVTTAVRSWTSHTESGGVVRPVRTAIIASRVMAPVAAVLVKPGDRVRQGAVLIALDNREVSAQRAAAGSAWAAANEAARAGEADALAAAAAVTLARATFSRIDALVRKQSATAQERDQAAAGLASAEAQLQSTQSRLAAAQASRDAARHSRDAADVGVTYATLTAPFDGIISERHIDPGSMALPGSPLLVVEDTTRYRLEAAVDSARAGRIAIGGTAEVRLDGEQAWAETRIVEIARVDPLSHSFVVKVDLPPGGALASGRFGRLRLAGATRDALTIPTTAAIARGQLTFVFLVGANGLARLRPITAGESASGSTEVLAGLRTGDRVVASPPPALVDGTRVAPTMEARAIDTPRTGRS